MIFFGFERWTLLCVLILFLNAKLSWDYAAEELLFLLVITKSVVMFYIFDVLSQPNLFYRCIKSIWAAAAIVTTWCTGLHLRRRQKRNFLVYCFLLGFKIKQLFFILHDFQPECLLLCRQLLPILEPDISLVVFFVAVFLNLLLIYDFIFYLKVLLVAVNCFFDDSLYLFDFVVNVDLPPFHLSTIA